MFTSTSTASSIAIVIGFLGAACAASAVLAAGQHGWDNCGTRDPAGEPMQDRALGYDPRDPASSPERAVSGYIEMIRLETKDSDAPLNRGAKNRAKSDLDQIIVYYNAAIKRDPKDDDAYFHRGLANFYNGFLSLALADLSQASKLDPGYAYYALWVDILDKRSNAAASRLPQAISQIDMTRWPAPVIRLFLGQAAPAAVLEAADDPDANTKRGHICEANFYLGEWALRQGAKADAERLFRMAAADCSGEFVEGPAAAAELKTIGVSL